MKAKFGSADTLHRDEMLKGALGDDEQLVRVKAGLRSRRRAR